MMSDELKELADKVEQLEMSQTKLIAELGMIAQKLGAEPSMKAVLDKIEELKAAAPITLYQAKTDRFNNRPWFASKEAAADFVTDLGGEFHGKEFFAHNGKVYRMDEGSEVRDLTIYTNYKAYVEERFAEIFTPRQRELLGLK